MDNVSVTSLNISGYEMDSIAYRCSILNEAGLISYYKGDYADDELNAFIVSRLTWQGHELLDNIREETIWKRTKEIIKAKGLPMILDVVKDVASSVIVALTQKAISGQ